MSALSASMTVAATIETGAGATPGPGLNKTPGMAHGEGRGSAAALWFMASNGAGAESFGAKWQTLLAGLHSSIQDSDATVTDQKALINESLSTKTTGKSSASNLAAGVRLSQDRGIKQERVEKGAEATLSTAGTQAQTVVSGSGAKAAKLIVSKSEEKNTAAATETESTRSSRPDRSGSAIKTDSVQAEPLTGMVSASIAVPSPASPADVITNPVVNSADTKAQLDQTKISVDLTSDQPAQPATTASASFGAQQPMRRLEKQSLVESAETVNPEVHPMTDGLETVAQTRQALNKPSVSCLPNTTRNVTESSHVDCDKLPAALPAAMPVESDISTEASASIRSLPATTDSAATSALTQETIVSSQNQIHTSKPSLCTTQLQGASTVSTQTAALSQNPVEIETTSETSPLTLIPENSRTFLSAHGQAQVVQQTVSPNVSEVAAAVSGDSSAPPSVTASIGQSGQLLAQPPIQDQPGSIVARKTSLPESSRSAHAAGNIDSVQQGSRPVEGQSSVSVVDSSAMARSISGACGIVSAASNPEKASSFATAQQEARDTFASLDTAVAPKAATWIHAGTQRAEAGFQDPALGWVSVRADLSGGGVHAQLVPGSADAAQALSSHLAGLNSYLVEHHTPVETLTLTAPEGGWSGLGSGRSAGEGMQQGAGQQTSQGADASISSAANPESVIQSQAPSPEPPAFFGDMNGSVQSASRSGLHISVMA